MIRIFIAALLAFNLFAGTVNAQAVTKRIPKYNGPEITQLLIDKTKRRMYLLSGTKPSASSGSISASAPQVKNNKKAMVAHQRVCITLTV